ncbi:MAG: succinate dehydrogenase, cytochrome b556 subunit [Steroidobacterales bacterium]
MSARPRPLSPHLQIYRWQLSNTLSVLHRLTGVGLSIGLPALAYWLVSLAAGQSAYEAAARFFASMPGELLLAGWVLAFFYHLLNGVRHLFWDIGYGFERRQRHTSGWLVVVGSLVLSAVVCVLCWRSGR